MAPELLRNKELLNGPRTIRHVEFEAVLTIFNILMMGQHPSEPEERTTLEEWKQNLEEMLWIIQKNPERRSLAPEVPKSKEWVKIRKEPFQKNRIFKIYPEKNAFLTLFFNKKGLEKVSPGKESRSAFPGCGFDPRRLHQNNIRKQSGNRRTLAKKQIFI